MATRIATGLVERDDGVDAFAEAAGRAALALGGAPVDLAMVFAGAANLDHADEGLALVGARVGAKSLVGCGAQGVVGSGRELEEGGVAVWAASLDEGHAETFHMQAMRAGHPPPLPGRPGPGPRRRRDHARRSVHVPRRAAPGTARRGASGATGDRRL